MTASVVLLCTIFRIYNAVSREKAIRKMAGGRKTMDITVIIPNYNGKHFLEPCLQSLEKQTYQEFMVMVVDNGSKDGSVELLEKKYPNVQLVKRDKNYGFSNAVNIGIKKANTPYVLLLNNDTETDTQFIERLAGVIKRDPKIFSVSSKMLNYIDRTVMDDAGDMLTIIGWHFQRGVGRQEVHYQTTTEVFSACAGAAIYRKEIFGKIGYFDEGHFAYLEDIDVGFRARIYGYKNVYCPDARVYHVGSGTSGSKYNDFKVKLSARNSIYLMYKNMPVLQLLCNILPLAVGYFIKWLFFVRIGYGRAYVNGLWEGILTAGQCKRVIVSWKHIPFYLKIELELIRNFFIYAYEFISRKQNR